MLWPIFFGHLAISTDFLLFRYKVDLPKFSIGLNRCPFSPNNDRWLFLGSFDLGCFRKIYLFKTWLNSRSHYHFFCIVMGFTRIQPNFLRCRATWLSAVSACALFRPLVNPSFRLWCRTSSLSNTAGPLVSDFYISFHLFPVFPFLVAGARLLFIN